ncbi:hypothetical protein ACFX2G_034987 [Malus domestica]
MKVRESLSKKKLEPEWAHRVEELLVQLGVIVLLHVVTVAHCCGFYLQGYLKNRMWKIQTHIILTELQYLISSPDSLNS